MIGLLIDSIFYSITNFQSSFIIFGLEKRRNIFYLIILGLMCSILMQSFLGIIYVFLMYLVNIFLKKYTHKKIIIYLSDYLILFNIHININNFICFIISVLFLLFNPYN